jgi:hypothetical protein
LQSTIIETPIGGSLFNKQILLLLKEKQDIYPFYAYGKNPSIKPFRETFVIFLYMIFLLDLFLFISDNTILLGLEFGECG